MRDALILTARFGGWCSIKEPPCPSHSSDFGPAPLESPDNEGLYKKMKRFNIE